MDRFAPYLLDRLIDRSPGMPDEATRPMLTIEQLKETVARDVESLLNTRCGVAADDVARFQNVRRSMLRFGLDDFAARSLASTDDQAEICLALARAISDHEPRLRQVRVELNRRDSAVRRLKFAIRAVLYVHPMQAPVNFDAVLQTATQQYAVTASRRLTETPSP